MIVFHGRLAVAVLFLINPTFLFVSAILQFEVHKRRNGDNTKEHDKYYNGYRRDIYIQEGSE